MRLPKIPDIDREAMRTVVCRNDELTKPPGSLGELERTATRLAGIQASAFPQIDQAWVVIAAGSHGVVEENVSAYPPEVTSQMVRNFLGGGAAVNALAKEANAEMLLVDAGIGPGAPTDFRLHRAGFGVGTANFVRERALPLNNGELIVERGVDLAKQLAEEGCRTICLGEMGIGNTTAASAVAAVVLDTDPSNTTGRGAMIDDEGFERKLKAIRTGISHHHPRPRDGVGLLCAFGGYETGFLAGCAIGAAANRIPVVMDGFPSTVAGLIATLLCPDVKPYLFAGHCSSEPGHRLVLEHLGLRPLLNLGMRLGEGTGAVLSLSILRAAAAYLRDMATFEEAGVSSRLDELVPV